VTAQRVDVVGSASRPSGSSRLSPDSSPSAFAGSRRPCVGRPLTRQMSIHDPVDR
jgi:hypothetical protein